MPAPTPAASRRHTVTAALAALPLVATLGAGVGGTATAGSPAGQTSSMAAGIDGEENPAHLGDPTGPVPVQVKAPAPRSARVGRQAQGIAGAASAARVAAVPRPTIALPLALDARPGYVGQTSCDPVAKPGAKAYAELMSRTFGMGAYGIERICTAGGTSEHKEGRAVDWMLNANNPAEKAVADQATAWLTANGGENARRLGVLYIIWNRKMWRAYAPERGWQPYVGDSPHTDHIHTSLTWDGAMGRTSWWTGRAVTRNDVGPCRVYRGQFAPIYTGPRYGSCPSTLPTPPASPYPVYVIGQRHAHIAIAQRALGVTPDGAFGPATRAALLTWQARRGVPRTGVLDNATWVALAPVGTAAPVVPVPPTTVAKPPTRALPLPKSVVTRYTPLKRLVLVPGSRGSAVRVLQRGLGLKGDGVFTATTSAAVRRIQQAYRLRVTGRTDLKTWNRVELRQFPWIGYARTTLTRGSRGPAVVALQRALRITTDGQFGPMTARAIMAVQQRYGLPTDGIARGATWQAVIAQAPR